MGIVVLSDILFVNMRVAIHMSVACVCIVMADTMRDVILWAVILFDDRVSVIGPVRSGCSVAIHSIVRTVAMTCKGVR